MTDSNDKDKKYFQQAMRGVRRLDQPKKITSPRLRHQSRPSHKPDSAIQYQYRANDEVHYGRAFKATRIDAELDLHNYNLNQAHSILDDFIQEAGVRGCQYLLIIHGKGQADAWPILKNAVASWLPKYSQVKAFHSAPLHLGGTGAVVTSITGASE